VSVAEGTPPGTDINVDPEFVRLIVAKGRAALFTLPDAEDDEPEMELELDAGTSLGKDETALLSDEQMPDATSDEVKAMIDGLNVDEQAELLALTAIGRGDYDPAEFVDAVRDAKANARGPASKTLFENESFPDELSAGLDAWEAWAEQQAE
jgi:hypothetical protein